MTVPKNQQRRTERRWPALIAIVITLVIYTLTPPNIVPRWVLIVVTALILIAMFALNPRRVSRQAEWVRWLAIGLSFLLVAANLLDVVAIVRDLIGNTRSGPIVLLFALQVWLANVVAFSIVYWELDRGGPVSRGTLKRSELPVADFKFPQDDDSGTASEVLRESSHYANWRPGFIDYLYFSATNMMAFSPTDVMPMTARAKILMLLQSFSGFILLALVIARSINILS